MKESKIIGKEILLIQKRIEFHERIIKELEEKKTQLMLDLENADFEERNEGQFINRFETSATELRNHTD